MWQVPSMSRPPAVDTLGAVDGAGIPQGGVGGDVVGGQAHGRVFGAPAQR